MNRNFGKLFMLLGLVCLAGCTQTTQSTTIPSSSGPTTSSSSSSTSQPEPVVRKIGYKYEDLGADSNFESIQTGGSFGGWFSEVSTGRFLAENSSYDFTFDSSYSVDTSFTVISAYTEHATVRMVEGSSNKFYLDTHTAGDTVLYIFNAIEDLVYRQVIRIRPSYDVDELLNVMYEADYYVTLEMYENYTGKWVYSLLDDGNSYDSVVSGQDDYDSATCTFGLEFEMFEESRGYYIFVATNTASTSEYTVIGYVCVSITGDVMYLYYLSGTEEHLLSILHNVDVSYVYEYGI